MQGMPMTNAPRVLLVEDDPAIARTVCYALERDGIAVRHCLQLADARAQWQAQPPDALLLDVGLPDGNGLDWCRELRQAGAAVPLLVLSARGEEMDRVLGLELGADDYLTKPFSPRELVAPHPRPAAPCAAPAARAHSQHSAAGRCPVQHRYARPARAHAGRALELTRREYQLLRCLLERPGRILSREFLLDSIWGQDSDSTDRTVDTHVKTLRAKLRAQVPQQDFITTHRGMGYSLTLPG